MSEVNWDSLYDDPDNGQDGHTPSVDTGVPVINNDVPPASIDNDIAPTTPTVVVDGASTNNDNLSGIELFLSEYDIEGGIINFDDGTSAHFNDLDAKKQMEILQTLQGNPAKKVAEQYGLDSNELQLINHLREKGQSVNDFISDIVDDQVNARLAMMQSNIVDYDKMDSDAIYVSFLRKENPNATREELEQGLTDAKRLSNYNSLTSTLKQQFVNEQKSAISEQERLEKIELQKEIDEDRRTIINAVHTLSSIGDITLNDQIKNSVLDDVLNVNDDGDSLFIDEVQSDPQKLFEAAFWYKFGRQILAQRDAYWKREKSSAYKRGRDEAIQGGTTRAKSFVANTDKHNRQSEPAQRATNSYNDTYTTASTDDLFDE